MNEKYADLEGTVDSVIYSNSETGYAVLKLSRADGETVNVTGIIPDISPGEGLALSGTYGVHKTYGGQFRAERISRSLPQDNESMIKYLSSGAIRGIGPAKARDIVDEFGTSSLDVIECEPEKLAQIRGISDKSARLISARYRHKAGLRRVIEYLQDYGVDPQAAFMLYKNYGDGAVEALHENPYIIAGELYGGDFCAADAMAIELGFDSASPDRVEAAVIFELAHNTKNGHSFIPHGPLIAATDELIGVGRDHIADAIENLILTGELVREEIAGVSACYLTHLHEAESFVAARLLDLADARPPKHGAPCGILNKIESDLGIKYSGGQAEAVLAAAESRALVITGGPGTGKTTSVQGILALFDSMNIKTALCAPTGRAAKRLSELTGREAATVHRLLGASYAQNESLLFEHDASNPLDADALIVDEMSMVDIVLMRAILEGISPDCRLILVGDSDQLPSIGPGNVFSDIIRSGAIDTVCLTELYRQAKESSIVLTAHAVNRGEEPELKNDGGDFFFLERRDPERAIQTIEELVCDRLPNKMGIMPEQIQIISPTRRRATGTQSLNARIQQAQNPQAPGKKELSFGNFIFREGDKVMQLRNNYDIIWKTADSKCVGSGIYNGDIGVISRIDYINGTVTVRYDDRFVEYGSEQLGELEPAYAITVHKSQGSEFDAVILSLGRLAPGLAVRSVLYTAITRAKKLLIAVGERQVFYEMIRSNRRQKRFSGLRARLTR